MHLQLKELNKNEKRYQIKNGKIVQRQVSFLPPSALIVHKLHLQIILMVLNLKLPLFQQDLKLKIIVVASCLY